MRALPDGTVTFLFTDIEGSTRLLHQLGDVYAVVLADHRRLLRAAFARGDEPPAGALHPRVLDYIRKYRLYR